MDSNYSVLMPWVPQIGNSLISIPSTPFVTQAHSGLGLEHIRDLESVRRLLEDRPSFATRSWLWLGWYLPSLFVHLICMFPLCTSYLFQVRSGLKRPYLYLPSLFVHHFLLWICLMYYSFLRGLLALPDVLVVISFYFRPCYSMYNTYLNVQVRIVQRFITSYIYFYLGCMFSALGDYFVGVHLLPIWWWQCMEFDENKQTFRWFWKFVENKPSSSVFMFFLYHDIPPWMYHVLEHFVYLAHRNSIM